MRGRGMDVDVSEWNKVAHCEEAVGRGGEARAALCNRALSAYYRCIMSSLGR